MQKTLLKLIASNWPFHNGSDRFLYLFGRNVDLGAGETACTTKDGLEITVVSNDLIGRHLILGGTFDQFVVDTLLLHAREGDVIADIGANIGYVSASLLARIPDSTVVCYEPQPGIADLLKRNLAQFGSRVRIQEIALSDRHGSGTLRIDPQNLGGSGLSNSSDGVLVPLRHAGEEFASFDRLDLLKIDVEGHEEPIIRALEPQIQRLRPRAILFEDHLRKSHPSGSIGAVFRRCGYKVFGLTRGLRKSRLIPIRAPEDCRFSDHLAVPLR